MWLNSVLFVFVFVFSTHHVPAQTTDEDIESNTISSFSSITSDAPESSTLDSTTTSENVSPFTLEILRVFIPGVGNTVKLVWGCGNVHLNITYGVHYGKDGEDITEPKLLTTNESAIIEELDFCTKYQFAVSTADENKINPNNIRSVITYLDPKAAPQNLQVDFEPTDPPCLLIKWSASCANIGEAIGYIISVFDHDSSRYSIVTLPGSDRVDLVHHLKAHYGAKFDIKVSTNFPGSKATEDVTYKVPNFLQPYRVRVTSNPEGRAFMIYWQEPYKPYFIDRLYYEVFIYRGFNVSSEYEKYYVTRPVLIYSGNETLYTFSVGSVSYDGQYRSLLTDPIVADIYGDVHELNA